MNQVIDPLTGEVINQLDENGHELPDDTPVAMPLGFTRQPTLIETIRAVIRTEASAAAASSGYGSFEEEDDFDVDDEVDPKTPWEEVFEPENPQPTEEDAKLVEKLTGKASEASSDPVNVTPEQPEA